MKSIRNILVFLFCLFALEQNVCAYEINKKWYGDFGVSIGYSFQGYSGKLQNTYRQYKRLNNYDTQPVCHNLSFGFSNWFHYKYNDFIHPFVGFSVSGAYSFYGSIFDKNDGGIDVFGYNEFFALLFDAGLKFNINKQTAFAVYYIIGMNLLQLEHTNSFAVNPKLSDIRAGLNTGIGLEVSFLTKYFVALEYKFSYNKFGVKFDNLTAEGHSLAIIFGTSLF